MRWRCRSVTRSTPPHSTVRRWTNSRRRTGSSRLRICSTRLLLWQRQTPERLNFGGLELAPLAGLEPFECQSCVTAAVEAPHRMADRLAHPLHLVLPPLVQGELDHRRAEKARVRRRGAAVVELHPCA